MRDVGETVGALAVGAAILLVLGEALAWVRLGRRPAATPARDAGGIPSLQAEPAARYR